MVFVKEETASCDESIDAPRMRSSDCSVEQQNMDTGDADIRSNSEPRSEATIQPEDLDEADGDLHADATSFSEEATAWDGSDMQHNIFDSMRDRFEWIIFTQSESEKCDLQDACCHFLEHENLPRIHRARANLMMVWLIETEIESARYAEIAGAIIDKMDADVLEMFGLRDGRIEELEKELYAAQEEAVRRRVEADAELDEGDDENETEDEEKDDEEEDDEGMQ